METKICSNPNCIHNGEPQPLSNFHKDRSKKDGYRPKCKDCRTIQASEYYQKNSKKILTHQKEYNLQNKEKRKEYKINYDLEHPNYQKEYYIHNKDKIDLGKRNWLKSLAIFKLWVDKLSKYEECRQDPDNPELLQVKCKYCGRWFNPTNNDIQKRNRAIKGNISGEQFLYCSESCKIACPAYKQKEFLKGFKPATSREVQPELRKLVLERDNWTCQKCNRSDVELHCHHIDPVSQNPIESADIDNCITLCKECHKWVHQNIPDCGYQELKCKK